jgi:peptidyl-prolyl cis-trans isomerase-like protein 2
VYAFDTIEELNVKTKNWKDLLTDEPFKRKDLITLQDPHNLASKDINQFHYKTHEIATGLVGPEENKMKEIAKSINVKGTVGRILAEVVPGSSSSSANDKKGSETSVTPSFVPKKDKAFNQAVYSNNAAAASFTSMGAVAVTSNSRTLISEDDYLISNVKGTAYAQIKTNFGKINIELFCGTAPRTCYNFIMLAKTSKS